eukprot:TRINITY_DN10737_c0_g2_i1.p1 TRINITY_DN10737_c0_g2~~TRINITY_DN10737_c0_g2_i1.p1  ORF type:complete len:479 (+),score=139.49 TRINITY_DN10737_c0_g2_i1:100-1536(+)
MSLLCRAAIAGAADFDPYGDDEAPKPKPKPKRPRGPRPPGAKGPPRPGQRPPQLKPDVDGFAEVDAEFDVVYAEEEGVRVELVKVEGALQLPVAAPPQECAVFTKTPQRFRRKLEAKTYEDPSERAEIPMLHFVDFGRTAQFTATRNHLTEEYCLASKTNNTMTLCPVSDSHSLRPYVDDAAGMISAEHIDKLMRYGRQRVNLADVLADVALDAQDIKAFEAYCRSAHYDTLDRMRFEEAWFHTKTRDSKDDTPKAEKPSDALMRRVFGLQARCELPVDRVLLTLRSIELGRDITQDEEDARMHRAQQREEDADQDNEEEVAGVEKVFDDDKEEELDADQEVAMDADIKQWHRSEVDAELTKAYREWRPETNPEDDPEDVADDASPEDIPVEDSPPPASRKRPHSESPPPAAPAKRRKTDDVGATLRAMFEKNALAKVNVPELRQYCKDRQVDTKGLKKADLVQAVTQLIQADVDAGR